MGEFRKIPRKFYLTKSVDITTTRYNWYSINKPKIERSCADKINVWGRNILRKIIWCK